MKYYRLMISAILVFLSIVISDVIYPLSIKPAKVSLDQRDPIQRIIDQRKALRYYMQKEMNNATDDTKAVRDQPYQQDTKENILTEEDDVTIVISAAGDTTLGRDYALGYTNSFDHEFDKKGKDYGYFFRNVKDIFEKDDLTIVNLETTLTNEQKKASKKFTFKAPPAYTEILKEGSVEAVNIANNHTYDYLEKGYRDTIENLGKAGIGYFGYENKYIKEVKGIKIGLLGYRGWDNSRTVKDRIKEDIAELKAENTQLIIVSFHWGNEGSYYPDSIQKDLAQFVIDQGANLVLGHHPHVVQGIADMYKEEGDMPVEVVYSLGNFSFGGNRNPRDKDTFIYRQSFHFSHKILVNEEHQVIPVSISSVQSRNNYQPTPLMGKEAERVSRKIQKLSNPLNP